MKSFRSQVRAYGDRAYFTVNASEEGKPVEDSIIDKLGKGDIKWDKSDLYSQKRTWLTYEEIVNDNRPLQTKNVLGVELATRA